MCLSDISVLLTINTMCETYFFCLNRNIHNDACVTRIFVGQYYVTHMC